MSKPTIEALILIWSHNQASMGIKVGSLVKLVALASTLWGCHRSLNVGYNQGDADAGDVGADANRQPWYVQSQPFASLELRLPAPTGVELSGSERTWLGDLTVAVAEDGHLLIGANAHALSGSQLFSFAPGAVPILETPNGVAIPNSRFQILPGRRIIFDHSGGADTMFQRVDPSPTWALEGVLYAAPSIISNPGQPYYHNIVSSNRSGENLVLLTNEGLITPSGRQSFRVLIRVAAEGSPDLINRNPATWVYEGGLEPVQIVGGDQWYLVSTSTTTLEVQPLSADFGEPRVRNGSTPWQAPLLTTDVPGGRPCGKVDAAFGQGLIGLYCLSEDSHHYIRLGRPETSTWTTPWIALSDALAASVTSMVWEPVHQHFALSLGTDLGYSTTPQESTRFFRIEVDGSISDAPSQPMSLALLVAWQNEVWAVGDDHGLGMTLFRPFAPNVDALRVPLPGWQRLNNAIRQNSNDATPNVLVSWSDARQTFVSRLSATDALRAETFSALPVPWGEVKLSGNSVYVRSGLGSSPLFQSGLVRMNAETLAIEASRVFDFDAERRVRLIDIAGDQPFLVRSTETRGSQIALFSPTFEVGPDIPAGTTLSGGSMCRDAACALSIQNSTANRIVEFEDGAAQSRAWRDSDAEQFGCPQLLREVNVRNAEGACEARPLEFAEGVPYQCVPEVGLMCAPQPEGFFEAGSYMVVLQAQLGGEYNRRERYRLGVFERGARVATESISFDASELNSSGAIRMVHIQGGLLAIVYDRENPLTNLSEVFARLVYFPILGAPTN